MTRRRPGFTLLEMMVVIMLIGLLFALLIQATKSFYCCGEGGQRAQCTNNIKNIDLAIQNYVSAHNVFPNAGTFEEEPAALASGDPADSVINDAFNGRFGRVRPESPDVGPRHSWVVPLLPYLDRLAMANDYHEGRSYLDKGRAGDDPSKPSNWMMTSSDIPILICPDDTTACAAFGKGNLSYAVNGGFSRWHAAGHAYGWAGTATGGENGPSLDWGEGIATRTGVMFLGTTSGKAPWDYQTTPAAISDGMAETVLVAENVRVGVSPGSPLTGNLPTNWACPHPNFAMVLASDDVCTRGRANGTNCSNVGDLLDNPYPPSLVRPSGSRIPPQKGWARANASGSHESINSGLSGVREGESPFPNGGHGGLVFIGMCDGSVRTVRDTIDGTVWARMMTPAGERLPAPFRQSPVGPRD